MVVGSTAPRTKCFETLASHPAHLHSSPKRQRQYAVVPLQRLQVDLAVQLADGQALRVHYVLVHRLVLNTLYPILV